TLKEAFERLETLVPNLNINDGFKTQLMRFEMHIRKVSSIDFFSKRTRRASARYEPPASTPSSRRIRSPATLTPQMPRRKSMETLTVKNKNRKAQSLGGGYLMEVTRAIKAAKVEESRSAPTTPVGGEEGKKKKRRREEGKGETKKTRSGSLTCWAVRN